MYSLQEKQMYFAVCVTVRCLFAVAAYLSCKWQQDSRMRLAAFFALIGAGLIFSSVKRSFEESPQIGFFGSTAYWPGTLHGALYLLSAFMLYYPNPDVTRLAWAPLVLDVLIGMYSFNNYHKNNT